MQPEKAAIVTGECADRVVLDRGHVMGAVEDLKPGLVKLTRLLGTPVAVAKDAGRAGPCLAGRSRPPPRQRFEAVAGLGPTASQAGLRLCLGFARHNPSPTSSPSPSMTSRTPQRPLRHVSRFMSRRRARSRISSTWGTSPSSTPTTSHRGKAGGEGLYGRDFGRARRGAGDQVQVLPADGGTLSHRRHGGRIHLRVPHPYCAILYKSCPADETRLDVITIFLQPLDEEHVAANLLMRSSTMKARTPPSRPSSRRSSGRTSRSSRTRFRSACRSTPAPRCPSGPTRVRSCTAAGFPRRHQLRHDSLRCMRFSAS